MVGLGVVALFLVTGPEAVNASAQVGRTGQVTATTSLAAVPDVGAPAPLAMANGNIHLFTRTTTLYTEAHFGSLEHRLLTGAGWAPSLSLGGSLAGAPAAASSGPGNLAVFITSSTGDLLQKTSDSAGVWSPWVSLGGGPTGRAAASSPAAGQVDVFVGGADGALWTRSTAVGRSWLSLGGRLAPGSGPAAVSTLGTTTVIVRWADNSLWSRTRDSAGVWAGWKPLGGDTLSDPAVAASAPGRLEVYLRGTDNGLWHRTAGTATMAWQPLGGQLASGPGATAVPGGGPVSIFALGGGDRYYSGTQTAAGSWSGWTRLLPISKSSWNPAVRCWATLTTVAEIMGKARSTLGGATLAGGDFRPGIPVKNSLQPPCTVNGVGEFVEIDNVRVSKEFHGGGIFGGPPGDGDIVGNLADPTQPLSLVSQIHGEIAESFRTAGVAPPVVPNDTLVDIQGFVYWDPGHVTEEWHHFTGWEIHPLSAWRPAQ
ncbi:MAG: hypothetical protein DLM59_16485 [Pseudonocardiales bacterium]|nr:MAG: hypothetical protein DLM59_16485 [Pseudonocardiales bacterium]